MLTGNATQSIPRGGLGIACGAHAGDPSTIRRTVRLALAAGTAIGANPGYPDLVGFGRRELAMASGEVAASVLYQVAGVAIRADLPRLGQLRPGNGVRFWAVTADEARLAFAQQQATLDRVATALAGDAVWHRLASDARG